MVYGLLLRGRGTIEMGPEIYRETQPEMEMKENPLSEMETATHWIITSSSPRVKKKRKTKHKTLCLSL
jgi:hypothetical protein